MNRRLPKLLLLLFIGTLLFCGCAVFSSPVADDAAVSPVATASLYEQAFSQAVSAQGEGDITAAIASCEQAALLDPTQTDPLRMLLSLYEQENAQDRANKCICIYETLYAMDQFDEADYLALGTLYFQQGLPSQMRTLLERGQVLNATAEKQALLDALISDVSKDTDAVQALCSELLDDLAAENMDAAVKCITQDAWQSAMYSRLFGGTRRYTETTDSGAQLSIFTKRGSTDALETEVWLVSSGKLTAVSVGSSRIVSLISTYTDGAANGAFTVQCCDAATGTFLEDSGTLQNNICTGDIASKAYFGGESVDLMTLFAERGNLTYTGYTGSFDENGHTTAAQQAASDGQVVVYAYSDNGRYYLYVQDPESIGATEYVFGIDDFLISLPPVW